MRIAFQKRAPRLRGIASFAPSLAVGALPLLTGEALALTSAEKGEVHVYVTDAKGKVPDLSTATALVYLESKERKRETLKATLELPAAKHGEKGHEEEGHAGGIPESAEVKEAGAWRVGVEFHASHGEHGEGEHGKKEHGHEKKEASGHKEEGPAVPHFVAAFSPEEYACPMKDSPPSEKAGKCPKCGMETKAAGREFDAVVVLKIGGETVNARGFHFPPARMPESFAAGVKAIEDAIGEMDRLVAAGQLDKIHEVADGIRGTARALSKTKDAPKDARLETAAKELVDLFGEIDEAADAGKAAETKTSLERYRKAHQTLTGLAPAGGEHKHD